MKKSPEYLTVNNFKLVAEEIELKDDTSDALYDIYYNSTNRGFFCVTPIGNPIIYGLKEPIKRIIKNHKAEILEYRLGKDFNQNEKVSVGDIFMWDGGYLERLTSL